MFLFLHSYHVHTPTSCADLQANEWAVRHAHIFTRNEWVQSEESTATAKWIHAQFLDGALSLPWRVIEYQEWKQIIYLCYKNDCRRHIAQLDPAFHQRNSKRNETKMKLAKGEKKA